MCIGCVNANVCQGLIAPQEAGTQNDDHVASVSGYTKHWACSCKSYPMHIQHCWVLTLSILLPLVCASTICTVENHRAYTGIRVMREWVLIGKPRAATRLLEPEGLQVEDNAAQRSVLDFAGAAALRKSGAPLSKMEKQPSKIVLYNCELGKVKNEIAIEAENLFNTTICSPSSSFCVRLVRRKHDANRSPGSFAMPGRLIGGFFVGANCSGYDDIESLQPFTPIQVESWHHSHSVVQTDAAFFRLALFRSPATKEKSYPRSLSWADSLNIVEKYR